MNSRVLFILAALIAYGSLYPFNFVVPEAHAAAWAKLFSDWSLLTSKGDLLGNITLFIPFGFAGVFAFGSASRSPPRIGVIVLASFALATTLQMAQIYFPPRQAAIADIAWEMIGTGLGIFAGMFARNRKVAPWQFEHTEIALPVALIALWLAAELLPFVPTLDAQSVKNSLRALLHTRMAPEQVVFHAAGAIIAGRALAAVLGEPRSLRWLLMLAGGVALGKVFIVTRSLDLSTLVGLTLGYTLWALLAHVREPRRSTAVFLLLFVAYIIGALVPFEIREIPESFNFVPFAALLRGSMLVNSASLAKNLCLYAGILGVIRMNGVSPIPSSIALALLVALFESMQTYLAGRTPDITEPLLVLLVGQVLRWIPLPATTRPPLVCSAAPPAKTPTADRPVTASTPGFNAVSWSLRLGIVCVAIAITVAAVLRLPQLPYNVAELFLGSGAFPFLAIFALALLWVGGGAYLVGRHTALSERPWVVLPVLTVGAGVTSLLLLCASVTQESIGDISGSNNLYWWVTNRDIWGVWARNLFLVLPSEFVSFLERPVRYVALYSPLVVFLALMFAFLEMGDRGHIRTTRAVPILISATLLLWLCKAIAFDWSSTDNLNELIARDGEWGLGGGGYLYALLVLICANAVLLARTPLIFFSIMAGASVTLAMVPVGWWLLNLGLEQQVHKYELIFSGVQFLLGPDRKTALGPEILFLRWSIIQVAGVFIIAVGARFARQAISVERRMSSQRAVRPSVNPT